MRPRRTYLLAVALLATACSYGALVASAASPGRNGTIAFARYNPLEADLLAGVQGLDLWVIGPNGSRATRIVKSVNPGASWSPDGAHIAYSSDCATKYDPYCSDIFVADATGRDRVRITGGEFPWHEPAETWPTWAPDGTRIAFARIWLTGRGIYVRRLDDRVETQVTKAADLSPAWSPDGTRIAFYRANRGLYVVNADGTRAQLIARASGVIAAPDWSPDGTRIVFTRGSWSKPVVCVIRANGGRARCLGNGEDARWSPDGKKIVFARTGHLYVMKADGTGRRRLTRSRFVDSAPSWQPRMARRGRRSRGASAPARCAPRRCGPTRGR